MNPITIIVLSALAVATVEGSPLGFGLVDTFVGALSDFGSTVLPEESMREGCRAVGLYNKEKDGGPLRSQSSSAWTVTGSGLARLGDLTFSKSSMETGCVKAGFYDPNLDARGEPKGQVDINITVNDARDRH